MREKTNASERNSTWEIVDKPRDKNTIDGYLLQNIRQMGH